MTRIRAIDYVVSMAKTKDNRGNCNGIATDCVNFTTQLRALRLLRRYTLRKNPCPHVSAITHPVKLVTSVVSWRDCLDKVLVDRLLISGAFKGQGAYKLDGPVFHGFRADRVGAVRLPKAYFELSGTASNHGC
jgi:hypothetical protein